MFFLTLRRPRCGRRGAGIATSAGHPAPRSDDDPRPPASCDRSLRSLLRRLLLAGDRHALGTLARARVRLGVLAAHRQPAAVADPAVAADLHQALDGLGALPAEVALNGVVAVDQVAEPRDLVLGEVADVRVRADPELCEEPVRSGPADPVDVREADLDALVEGDVDPRNSSQSCYLPLTLLVTRVRADHQHAAVPADDLALLAHRLDRRSYLHGPFRFLGSAGWLWLPVRPPLPSPDAGRRLAAPNATSEYSARVGPRSPAVIDRVYRSGGQAFDIGR